MSGNDEKRSITTTDGLTLPCDKFIPFGFDSESIAVCGGKMYLKQPDGKYRHLSPFEKRNK